MQHNNIKKPALTGNHSIINCNAAQRLKMLPTKESSFLIRYQYNIETT